MSIRITTLSENTAHIGDFLAEWGLSILVEAGKTKVLLDTGKEHSCVYNADTLGLNSAASIKLSLCHCTDLPVITLFAKEFGDTFTFNKAGTVIEFP